MSVEIKIYDDPDAVAADARGALDRDRQRSLFKRLDWFRLTLRHCRTPGRALIVMARDGDRAAWLFLTIDRRHGRALASWYSLRVGPIFYGRTDPALMAGIARALRGRRMATLTLEPLEEADANLIATGFAQAGWWAVRQRTGTNWAVSVSNGFEQYWSQRPSRLVNTVRRQQMASDWDIVIHSIYRADDWCSYREIYEASWKPAEGSFAFLEALARQEGEAGTLRLGIARLDGCPVAAQFWLVENGVATIHKLAHRQDQRHRSPGTILSAAMFRHVIEQDGVREIDFGTGDDPYKRDWMDEPRPLYSLSLYDPRTIAGSAGFARRRLSTLVRRGASD